MDEASHVPLVDFHLHTTISDGVWSPGELFAFIRASEIAAFSVTDHDTMDVYPVPADLSARCIPGVEVDTKCSGVTAHLLCYGIRSPHSPLLQHLRAQRLARRTRMEEMVDELQRRNVAIEMNDVEREAGTAASLGRPHLARALVRLGAVGTVQEAFDRYIADTKDAYVSLDRLTSADAIAMAHESGAVVSIAHPARLKPPASLDALREAGADAVEIIHPTADADLQRALAAYADEHGILATAGSDFHTPDGGHHPGVHFSEEHFHRMMEKLREPLPNRR